MSQVINLTLHIGDDGTVSCDQGSPGRGRPTGTKFLTSYRSERQAFALGTKLYDSDQACRIANGRHPNFAGVVPISMDVHASASDIGERRFWALMNGEVVGKNSFASIGELKDEYEDENIEVIQVTKNQGTGAYQAVLV